MNRDLAMSKFDARFAYENRNLRLITDEATSKFVMTNEKGPQRIDVWVFNSNLGSWVVGDIYGTTIGVATIDSHLVLFTHGLFRVEDPETHQGRYEMRDRIYRVDFDDEDSDGMFVRAYELFVGNLGFDLQHPIETLPFYETEDIQKVYWTDGINQPRMINIMADYSNYTETSFDFAQQITGHETISVEREDNTNGLFPSGTIQYAFTYYKQYGQESSVAAVSFLAYIADEDRGSAHDETVACSFKLTLRNLSYDFDGVRIYSIIRTSLNATPIVKRVADVPISTGREYAGGSYRDTTLGIAGYTDNNNVGEDVESTYLLYVGAKEITCETLTQKDNTAFYGNIEEKHSHVEDDLRNQLKVGSGGVWNLEWANDKTISMPNTRGKYEWSSQLNKNADAIRFFQYREVYRFGVQLQDKFGNWSDVIRIESGDSNNANDFEQTLAPESDVKDRVVTGTDVFKGNYSGLKRRCASFGGTLDISDMGDLLGDYVAIRPVVVYPEFQDRNVLAQGILTPTVYNLDDRVNNGIYGQMSWFSRPIVSDYMLCPDSISNIREPNQITDLSTLEVRHYQPLPPVNRYVEEDDSASLVKWYFGGNAELLCNFEGYKNGTNIGKTIDYTFWANVHPFQERLSTASGVEQPEPTRQERARQLRSEFFVDQSVETFHSPDVEFTDNFANMDMDGMKMRIVGVVPMTYRNEGVYMAADKVSEDNYFHVPNRYMQRGGYSASNYSFRQMTEFGGVQGNFENASFTASNAKSIMFDSGHLFDVQEGDEVSTGFWGTNKIYPWHTKTMTAEPSDTHDDEYKICDRQVGYSPFGSDFDGTPKSTFLKKIYDTIKYSYDTLYFDDELDMPIDTPSYFNTVDGGMVNLDVDGTQKVFDFNVDKTVVPNVRKESTTELKYVNGFLYPGQGLLSVTHDGSTREKYGTSCIFSSEALTMRYRGTSSLVMHLPSVYNSSTSKKMSTSLPKYGDYWNNAVIYDSGTPREKSRQILWREDLGLIHQATYVTQRSKTWNSSMSYLWDEGCGGIQQDYIRSPFTLLSSNNYGFFYLAELYRDNVNSRFGGETEEALAANTWLPCGDAVPLRDVSGTLKTSVSVNWTQGDTYYQRYDNLHTYPYTEEDVNQIVDIVSFMCETRVNIDGRYDKNRGLDNNENTRPTNANRVNGVYGQDANYFRYRAIDHNRLVQSEYPMTVAWTKTKQAGEWVDVWTNVTLANTIEMDGAKGKVRALRRHFDDILAFQDTGVSRILFNEQQAVQTEAGVPLEIANSSKVTGRYYISPNLGCHNKWSIGTSPMGTYFFDDAHQDILFVNSERQIKSVGADKGFRSWAHEKADMAHMWGLGRWDNIRTLYDKRNGEMMFVTEDDALSFNEQLGAFTSFYDYGKTPFLETVQNHYVMMRSEGGYVNEEMLQPRTYLYEHNQGEYNDFFGTYQPFWTEMLCHSDGSDKDSSLLDKTWTNVSFQFDTFDDIQNTPSTRYKESEHFDVVDCETEYQSGSTAWTKRYPGIEKKFRMWHADLPRDGYTASNDGFTADRLRNPWLRIRLTKNTNLDKDYRSVLHSVTIGYLE